MAGFGGRSRPPHHSFPRQGYRIWLIALRADTMESSRKLFAGRPWNVGTHNLWP
jgi:hypothetical protein